MKIRNSVSGLAFITILAAAGCSSSDAPAKEAVTTSTAGSGATTVLAEPTTTLPVQVDSLPEDGPGPSSEDVAAACAGKPSVTAVATAIGKTVVQGNADAESGYCEYVGETDSALLVSFNQVTDPAAVASFKAAAEETGAVPVPDIPDAKSQFGSILHLDGDTLQVAIVFVPGNDIDANTAAGVEVMKLWIAAGD